MATWKSNKSVFTEDMYDRYIECEGSWEYQTTADVFSYKAISLEQSDNGYDKIEIGDVIVSITASPEMAENLYHALANWMRTYNNDNCAMKAIDSNRFEIIEKEEF